MIQESKYYPSKLLLFGEYGILLGLKALLIPYETFSGKLVFRESKTDGTFLDLLSYLKSIETKLNCKLNLKNLEVDIQRGLQFESTIPHNYGLGSSGALVAAIFQYYSNLDLNSTDLNLNFLRKDLALAESFFHGKSSGVDPLVSLLQKPVIIDDSADVKILNDFKLPQNNNKGFFIVDSKLPGKTGNLVSNFLKKIDNKEFNILFTSAYGTYSNLAIENLISGKSEIFAQNFAQLSEFQLINMSELIPHNMQEFFRIGIESKNFYLKICGSGGGGYFLGWHNNKDFVKKVFNDIIFI